MNRMNMAMFQLLFIKKTDGIPVIDNFETKGYGFWFINPFNRGTTVYGETGFESVFYCLKEFVYF